MKFKAQLFVAVAVSAAGVMLWSTRQLPSENLPEQVASFQTSTSHLEDLHVSERPSAVVNAVIDNVAEDMGRDKLSLPQQSHGVIDVTDSTFSSIVLNSDQPASVTFGADWCGACRLLDPVICELAVELDGKALVTQVDVDANPRLAQYFGIRALPTTLVFNEGSLVETIVGVAPKAELKEKLTPQAGTHEAAL